MIAIVEAYYAGLLEYKNWLGNVIAGLVVGVVALPLAMAFAIASGVKPEQGLYTAIIAGILVAIFGGSRTQIAGPTGAFIVILAGITARYGVDGLQIATLFAGIILIFMGIIKLGNVIKFIPDPVIVGFTSGIGVIIFIGEWKDFFGLPISLPLDARFYHKAWLLLQNLAHFDLATTSLALFSLLIILATPKLFKRIPGPLLAMVVATFLQSVFHFHHVATIGSAFGGIPSMLPHFQIPSITLNRSLDLIAPAFTIALLGAIESLLCASAADGMAGTRHNSNQELIGQGLANIVCPLFNGFAATGAIARTATNIRNGGTSPIAAIVHAILLILVIVLLAPLAANVPLCVLAAILFVVAYNMSDFPHFIQMLKHGPGYDVLVLLTTFLLTVFTDLVIAVNGGVILAMMLFVRRMHQSVSIEQHSHQKIPIDLAASNLPTVPKDTLIYTIQGPFFFGVAEKIERAITYSTVDFSKVIFRLREVPFIDMTGLETFSEVIVQYHKRGIKIYLCEANTQVARKIAKMEILQWVVGRTIFSTLAEAINVQI